MLNIRIGFKYWYLSLYFEWWSGFEKELYLPRIKLSSAWWPNGSFLMTMLFWGWAVLTMNDLRCIVHVVSCMPADYIFLCNWLSFILLFKDIETGYVGFPGVSQLWSQHMHRHTHDCPHTHVHALMQVHNPTHTQAQIYTCTHRCFGKTSRHFLIIVTSQN